MLAQESIQLGETIIELKAIEKPGFKVFALKTFESTWAFKSVALLNLQWDIYKSLKTPWNIWEE